MERGPGYGLLLCLVGLLLCYATAGLPFILGVILIAAGAFLLLLPLAARL